MDTQLFLASKAKEIYETQSSKDEEDLEEHIWHDIEASTAPARISYSPLRRHTLRHTPQGSSAALHSQIQSIPALSQQETEWQIVWRATPRAAFNIYEEKTHAAAFMPRITIQSSSNTTIATTIICDFLARESNNNNETVYKESLSQFIDNFGAEGITTLHDCITTYDDNQALWIYINILDQKLNDQNKKVIKPILISSINHSSAGVRNAAAAALGSIKDSDAKSAIDKRLKIETNKFVRSVLEAYGTKL